MALAGRIAPSTMRNRQPCAVTLVVKSLPKSEAKELVAMLAKDSGWTGAAIADALDEEGYRADGKIVRANSINRHRLGRCACDS